MWDASFCLTLVTQKIYSCYFDSLIQLYLHRMACKISPFRLYYWLRKNVGITFCFMHVVRIFPSMLSPIFVIFFICTSINTFKYHVFAPMGRFQLELIYLYFTPSFHLTVVVSVLYVFRCYNNINNRSCGCWSYFCLQAWAVARRQK